MLQVAIISLNTGDRLNIGPLGLPWHGLFTAVGILVAAVISVRFARERELNEDRLIGLIGLIVFSGMVGARLFYLVEQEPHSLLRPTEWLGTTGFSFYGAIIAGVASAIVYLRNDLNRLALLDGAAAGFGLGMAIGRIGDVLIGEHLGDPSSLPWAFRYTNPDALAPTTFLAYQPGALYESLLGLAIFGVVWPLRDRFPRPGMLIAVVVGSYALGRFGLFFLRNDSDQLIAGLSNAQVSSLVIAVIALLFAVRLRRDASASAPGP